MTDVLALMPQLRDIASAIIIAIGLFFVVVGAIGVVRLPDFYTRLHGAGVTDTLGAELVLLGLIIRSPDVLTALKLGVIVIFLFITSPTSTHALANAAYTAGVKPMLERFRSGSPDARTGARTGATKSDPANSPAQELDKQPEKGGDAP